MTKNNNQSIKPKNRQARVTRAIARFWVQIWRSNPPSTDLIASGLLVGLLMATPIVYVAVRAAEAGPERWLRLLNTRIPQLLWSTLTLTAAVTFFAVSIGVVLALLTERTDLPGRKVWQWLIAIPLVIPPYVGALAYIIVFGPAGWLRDLLGQTPLSPFTFWGTAFILIIFTYPFVYLLVAAALRRMNVNFEEAARALGLSPVQVLRKVIIPLLRPAIGAGAVLVALYVLSDFGAIAMLRYDTFTRAIYFQMTGRFDRSGAAVLSTILIVVTLILLWLEAHTKRRQKFYQTTGTYRHPQRFALGSWKLPALLFTFLIFIFSVALPLTVLSYWAGIGIRNGALNSRFFLYAKNSLQVSALAAILCMALSVPVVYLKSRYPSLFSRSVDRLIFAGYALPGVIVALGIIFLFNRYAPWLYTTTGMIITAYVIRFLPQSMQSGEASLALVSPRLDEAARSMGTPSWQVLWKVIVPMMLPGVMAGGALVFVSSLKELPATLLLRPAGFDTLAVRIWIEAHEGFYAQAAVPALLMILVSMLPLRWMLKRD